MNETTADPSLRYDSAAGAVTTGDDRHTIQTYLSDALALERHIAQPLQRQLDSDDSAQFGRALEIISTIKATTDSHLSRLEAQLEAAGGHAASPIKSAWAQILGAGAAVVDGSRKMKVSKNLRDDYTALALATISYTMLHATALGLGDESTAAVAKQHLDDYAPIIVNIAKAMPVVVLEELRIDGENVQVSAAHISEQATQDAWK
jgi:ferritin-like metal-binding protein YciE